MDDRSGYAVYFFPQALDALGDAIKPFLVQGPAGEYLACRELDTAGAFVDITVDGQDAQGKTVEFELMVPTNMVRMIVSTRADEVFGFVPRGAGQQALPATTAVSIGSEPAAVPKVASADEIEG